jgi:membrane protein implicated in regulation of membrane protease activity
VWLVGLVTTTPSAVPALPPDAALLEATRRAERLAEHGPTVHGPSATGLLVVPAALMALAVPVVVFGERWWIGPVTVAVLGVVLAVRSWLVARRRHTLQPFRITTDERPFAVLDRGQRQRSWRQITGRGPVTADSAPLVRAFLGWQRRSSRAAVPGLVALGVVLVGSSWGLALASGDVWLLVLLLVVAVFITVMNAIEARRMERVLRSLPDPSSSPAQTTGPIA